jgi:hypothetical protein
MATRIITALASPKKLQINSHPFPHHVHQVRDWRSVHVCGFWVVHLDFSNVLSGL